MSLWELSIRVLKIVGIILLFLSFLALVAYAVTVPLWIGKIPGAVIVSVQEPALVGLIAVVIAILSLGSALAYFLLNREMQRRQQEINQEAERRRLELETAARATEQGIHRRIQDLHRSIQAQFDVAYASSYSFMAYLEYSKTWTDASFFFQNIRRNRRFQVMVAFAVSYAEAALSHAEATMPEGNTHRVDAINALAYHRSTQYIPERNEANRLRATTLANQLRRHAGNSPDYWETLAWVNMACFPKNSPEFNQGQAIVEGLLGRVDLPSYWRELMRQKYNTVFRVYLQSS